MHYQNPLRFLANSMPILFMNLPPPYMSPLLNRSPFFSKVPFNGIQIYPISNGDRCLGTCEGKPFQLEAKQFQFVGESSSEHVK